MGGGALAWKCVVAAEWSESMCGLLDECSAERSEPIGLAESAPNSPSSEVRGPIMAEGSRSAMLLTGSGGEGASECGSAIAAIAAARLSALRCPSVSIAIGAGAGAACRLGLGSEIERRMTGPSSERESERTWREPGVV